MSAGRVRTILPWPLILAGALLLGFLVLPFLALLGALPEADGSSFLGSDARAALSISLVAASAATVVDAVLGFPLGMWLAGTASRLKHVVTVAVLLPLAVPPVVGGLEIVLLLGPNGWLGSRLDRLGLDPLDTIAGTILAQMFVAAPFVVISARAAFSAVDSSMVDAARSLGSGPGRTFFQVMIPAARRGLMAGLVLGWVRCMGEFGATAVVAYHPYTLPTLTYVNLSGEGLKTALPAGTLLAAVGAITAGLMLWFDSRRRQQIRRSPLEAPPSSSQLAWVRPVGVGNGVPWRIRAVAEFPHFDLNIAFETDASSIAILGPSGAGKSLTLRTIAGLLRPRSGLVVLDGRVLLDTSAGVDVPPEHRGLGYVAQRDGLFEHLDVERNLRFALTKLPGSEGRARLEELLAGLGLGRIRSAKPETLSGGERQRTALGRALALGPSALLLDEPFSNVDAAVRRDLRALVRGIHDRTGLPMVLVTHDREDTLDLSDYVIVVEKGRVVQHGAIEDVFARPASRSIAHMVGIPNVLEVRSLKSGRDGRVRAVTAWGALLVEPPDQHASAWELAIPSEAIQLDFFRTEAEMVSVRPSATAWRVRLVAREGGALLEALIPYDTLRHRPTPGTTCGVSFDTDRCHLMPADSGLTNGKSPHRAERHVG